MYQFIIPLTTGRICTGGIEVTFDVEITDAPFSSNGVKIILQSATFCENEILPVLIAFGHEAEIKAAALNNFDNLYKTN